MACHTVSPLLKDNHSITKWHKVVAGEGDDLANLDYITAIVDDDFSYTVNVRGNWYDVLQAEERRREIRLQSEPAALNANMEPNAMLATTMTYYPSPEMTERGMSFIEKNGAPLNCNKPLPGIPADAPYLDYICADAGLEPLSDESDDLDILIDPVLLSNSFPSNADFGEAENVLDSGPGAAAQDGLVPKTVALSYDQLLRRQQTGQLMGFPVNVADYGNGASFDDHTSLGYVEIIPTHDDSMEFEQAAIVESGHDAATYSEYSPMGSMFASINAHDDAASLSVYPALPDLATLDGKYAAFSNIDHLSFSRHDILAIVNSDEIAIQSQDHTWPVLQSSSGSTIVERELPTPSMLKSTVFHDDYRDAALPLIVAAPPRFKLTPKSQRGKLAQRRDAFRPSVFKSHNRPRFPESSPLMSKRRASGPPSLYAYGGRESVSSPEVLDPAAKKVKLQDNLQVERDLQTHPCEIQCDPFLQPISPETPSKSSTEEVAINQKPADVDDSLQPSAPVDTNNATKNRPITPPFSPITENNDDAAVAVDNKANESGLFSDVSVDSELFNKEDVIEKSGTFIHDSAIDRPGASNEATAEDGYISLLEDPADALKFIEPTETDILVCDSPALASPTLQIWSGFPGQIYGYGHIDFLFSKQGPTATPYNERAVCTWGEYRHANYLFTHGNAHWKAENEDSFEMGPEYGAAIRYADEQVAIGQHFPRTVDEEIFRRECHRECAMARLEGVSVGKYRYFQGHMTLADYVDSGICVCWDECACTKMCTRYGDLICPCSGWIRVHDP